MKTNRNQDTQPTQEDVARAFAQLPVEILFALACDISPGRPCNALGELILPEEE